MKYRKLPVEIEAVLWTGDNIHEVEVLAASGERELFQHAGSDDLIIDTLEGEMTARIGDFIIKGVHDELYPCKPDIFAKTYEPA